MNGWIWAVAVAGLITAKFWYLTRTYMFMDPAQYLYAAELWWDGGSLYRDFVDTNPPFVIFFSLPPVLLSRLTSMAVDTALWIYSLSWIVLSLAILRVLLNRVWSVDSARIVHMFWFIMALVMLSPSDDVFGQREHMSLILLLPYLTAAALHEQGQPLGRGSAVWIGILASWGVLLKPYLAVVPCGVEIYLAVARRDWKSLFRPESLTIAASIAVYLAVVVLYTPDYFRYAGYAAETLWAYNWKGNMPVRALEKAMPLVLAAVAVLMLGERRDAAFLRLLWLAALLFYVPVVVYGKYWCHHLFPHTTLCWLILGIVLLRLCVGCRLPWQYWTLLPGLVLIGIWGLVSQEINLAKGRNFEHVRNEKLIPIIQNEAAGQVIYCLTAHLGGCFPLVNYTETKLGGRFAFLWPVPGYFLQRWTSLPPAEQYLSPEVLAADNPNERQVLREVVADLIRHKPLLILVQTNRFKVGETWVLFDPLEYVAQDEQFVNFFREYRLWRRVLVRQNQTDIYRRENP
ncbi:MAG: hypothetical protein K9N21_13905 [Deltaproteobacteria bacterium]|nr:hypothetical protein [Deltaproteobacteria bacterium]